MAGRGARAHVRPPSKIKPMPGEGASFVEVDELSRIRKLFPDARERQNTNLPEMPFEDGAYKGHIDDNGRRNGYGIFTDAAGNSYEGEWLNDEKHGFFSITYQTGERFEGHFVRGRRFGEGTSYYVDGSRFHGDYRSDLRHGRGMFWSEHDYYALQKLWMRKYENGRLVEEHEIYTDNQRDAEPQIEGYGTYIDEMGRRFEGDFVEFQMHGKGRFTYPDGRVELGEWKLGLRQGIGMAKRPPTEEDPKERFYFQVWKDGELVSEAESDRLNYDNFYWYDEGGYASHNY